MPLPQPHRAVLPASGILPLGCQGGFGGRESGLSCLWLSPGALVHVLHRPAAALPALEHLQRGDQAEHVPGYQLPQPGFHHPACQLQQLQTAHEQQGLDLRPVRAGRGGHPAPLTRGEPRRGCGGQEEGVVPPPTALALTPFSRAQVSAVCQHVRRLSPRGEGALRLVPGLQPRWPPPAHHEVAGDQLPLPRRLRPPLRVRLSPSTTGGDGRADSLGLLPRPLPPCIYFGVKRGPVCAPSPPAQPFLYWIKTKLSS